MLYISAGAGDARYGAVGHQVGLALGAGRDVAFAEFAYHRQGRRADLRQPVGQVLGAQVGQGFQYHMARRLPHLADIPFVMPRGGIGADPAAPGGAGPAFYALLLDQAVVILIGVHAGEVVGGGAGGDGVEAFRVLVGELEGDGAADGFADEMHPLQGKEVQEVAEVGGETVQGPLVAGFGDGGAPEAAGVHADDAVLAGQQGRPGVPEAAALGVAVVEDDGLHALRGAPGVGEVVVIVVHLQVAGQGCDGHSGSP